jgi:hypothetical protein
LVGKVVFLFASIAFFFFILASTFYFFMNTKLFSQGSLLLCSIFVIGGLATSTISTSAATTSPFWDAANSGAGYQNIKFTNGWVGIGVNSPTSQLDVANKINVSNIANPTQSIFNSFDNTGGNYVGSIGVYKTTGVDVGFGKLAFNTSGGSAPGNGTGFIGMRVPNPVFPLDVNGTVHTNSDIQVDGRVNVPDTNKPAGTNMVSVGDDAYLTDVDQANTLGVYSSSNTTKGYIKLGSGNSWIKGDNGNICIGAC